LHFYAITGRFVYWTGLFICRKKHKLLRFFRW